MYNSFIIQEYVDRYHSYVQIYTDTSKNPVNKVGVAFLVPEFHIKVGKRIKNSLKHRYSHS